jgi:hypothetical protein
MKPIVLIALAFTVACLLALYVWEFVPRYVTLPLRLPEDDIGWGWKTTERSTIIDNWDFGRVFTWAQHSSLYFKDPHGMDQFETTRAYFARQVKELGWAKSQQIHFCDRYLPDAQLLVKTKEGIIMEFHQPGHPVYAGEHYFGDLVCVSVLKDSSVAKPGEVVSVTVFTARQSLLRLFTHEIMAINY